MSACLIHAGGCPCARLATNIQLRWRDLETIILQSVGSAWPASLLIFVFFDYANSIKILAAGMPITPIDLTSTFKYPLGLLKSIGFNGSNLIDASLKSLFVLTFIFLVIHFFRSWIFFVL